MDTDIIKTLLNRIAESEEEKEAVLEWVIYELICQAINSEIPRKIRREKVMKIVESEIDRWI